MAESQTPVQSPQQSLPNQVLAPGKTPPNKRVLGVVALIALLALGAGGRMWYRSQHVVDTENAYLTGRVHPRVRPAGRSGGASAT